MIGYRFGKHPPKNDYRTLRFRNYVTAGLAPPPTAFNVLSRVYDSLHTTDPAQLFPMDGNDRYGDCTIAALGHAITVYRGMIGTRRIMTERAVLKLYMHLTGGVDSGLNELDVLGYWRKHAVDGDKNSGLRQDRPEKPYPRPAGDPAFRRRLYRLPGAGELHRGVQCAAALVSR